MAGRHSGPATRDELAPGMLMRALGVGVEDEGAAAGARADPAPSAARARLAVAAVIAGTALLAGVLGPGAGAGRYSGESGSNVRAAAAVAGSVESQGDSFVKTKKFGSDVVLGAAAAAAVSMSALAGDAVQWRVADGGNGHWYAAIAMPSDVDYPAATAIARQRGGYLFSGCGNEFDIVVQITDAMSSQYWLAAQSSQWFGPWIGIQLTGNIWGWSDSSTCTFDRWDTSRGQPNNPGIDSGETVAFLYSVGAEPAPVVHDVTTSRTTRSLLIEWSADCNSDGIVDYGQCHDGTLPDYNGNNIPDCCEQGTPCLPGRYPLHWRTEDGGNGHWYQASANLGLTFLNARNQATGVGGDLVTPQSPAELDFVFRNLASDPAMWWHYNGIPRHGPWIGLRQDRGRPDYFEPAGGWTWIDGTYATFQNWALDTCQTQPTDCFCGGGCGLDNAGFYEGDPASGNTVPTWGAFAADMSGQIGGVIIEWSADCNSDGIIDYGQILNGQLADTNTNGIPDCCEPGNNCCVGDIYVNHIIDGGDLGILLSEWGVVTPTTNSDLNRDGFVNGADLGMLLANWGPCGG
jgi:hypothetical protein